MLGFVLKLTFGVVSGWDDEQTNQTSQQTVPLEQDEPATVRKGSDGSEKLYNNLDLQAVRFF